MRMFSTLRNREELEKREREILAPYAVKSGESEGRVRAEEEDPYRTCFQRDRDRIIHCKSFRRLQEKTQVFIASEGDHYRNRMTHSVECSQISRAICRTFGLNEDLAEAISLAHDLGHTPFGHAGEFVMDSILQQYGLHFEHNEQSLRIVEKLEKMYPDFDGLNLSKEVLDGMLKHRTPYDRPKISFVRSAHLEGQVVDLADEIAYTSADIDDGLRSEMFGFEDIRSVPVLREILERVLSRYGAANRLDAAEFDESLRRDESLRSRVSSVFLNMMVEDVYGETARRLEKNRVIDLNDVRNFDGILVSFSDEFRVSLAQVRKFLLERFYYSPKVREQTDRGQQVIRGLFEIFYTHPDLLPEKMQRFIAEGERKEIIVKDYIAGMTDVYAEKMLLRFRKK